MKRVIIMRGPSGSGKTTFVERNFPYAVVVSADMYFTTEIEWADRAIVEYNFEPAKLGMAHAWCMNQFILNLFAPHEEVPIVVVDNTNTCIWEFANYVLLSKRVGVTPEVITTDLHHQSVSALELSRRTVHKVPIEIIERMIANYERYEQERYVDSYVDGKLI